MNRGAFVSAADLRSLAFAPVALAQAAKPTPATPQGRRPGRARPSSSARQGARVDAVHPGRLQARGQGHRDRLQSEERLAAPDRAAADRRALVHRQRQQITGDTETVKRIAGRSRRSHAQVAAEAESGQSQNMFAHVNGKVDPKRVKEFD